VVFWSGEQLHPKIFTNCTIFIRCPKYLTTAHFLPNLCLTFPSVYSCEIQVFLQIKLFVTGLLYWELRSKVVISIPYHANNFSTPDFKKISKTFSVRVIVICSRDEPWPHPTQPDMTQAYFWPAVNKSLWPGYFLTWPDEIFLKNWDFEGKIFLIQWWLIRSSPTQVQNFWPGHITNLQWP